MRFWYKTRWLHPEADAGGEAPPAGESQVEPGSDTAPAAEPQGEAPPAETPAPAEPDKDALIRTLTEQVSVQQQKLNVQDRALAEKMNTEERLSLDLQQRQAAVEASEAALALEKRARFAVDAALSAGLVDEAGDAVRWADYVLGEDDKATSARAAGLKQKFDRAVQAEVKRRFKEIPGAPGGGGEAPPPAETAPEALAKDLAQKTGTKTARDIRAHYIQ